MPMNPLLKLTSADLNKAAALQAQIEKLQTQLAKLVGAGTAPAPALTKTGRGPISDARRKRLSQIAKKRWKQVKAAGKKAL
jgi:hypothetical protein